MGSSTPASSGLFERLVAELSDIGGLPAADVGKWRRLGHFAIGAGLVAAAIVGTIVGVMHAAFHLQSGPLADIETFYTGAARLNIGDSLYPADANPDVIPYYYYPPLLAILLRPFALLPYPVFAALWEAGTILVFVLFVRRIGLNRRTAIALGILGYSIAGVLPLGQTQAHITWLMSLGSPFAIALAGQVKIFPALLALYWVGRGQYRQFALFLGWTAVMVLFQFVLEPDELIAFVDRTRLGEVGTASQLSPYAIAPWLWFALVVAFVLITPLVARTRFGWATAVAFATLATPRLFGYHLLSLGAALRPPDDQAEGTSSRFSFRPRPRDSG